MKQRVVILVFAVLFVGLVFHEAGAVEVTSKAKEINLTGRVHTQWNSSSVEGELSNEFFIRRARITAEVVLNDVVSGKVQPDYGQGKLSLKDAYMKLKCSSNLSFRLGQFKRPFDLFELTSSTKILVVERTGKIRGASGFTSLSGMTEGNEYSDRDIGVEGTVKGPNGRFTLTAAVTNGLGANDVPHKTSGAIGEKQFTGRAVIRPVEGKDLAIGLSGSARPHTVSDSTAATTADLSVEYSPAVMLDLECGNFKRGLHVQAGGVWGENWEANQDDPPTFLAGQVIASFREPIDNAYFEAIEPLFRASYADPDSDTDDDAGILLTPGVQLFLIGRNKLALNLDVFLPQNSDLDTEYSIKAQSSVHF